ncbi:MAG: bifunctional 4-hydroxy-2-oxoglutarate aldolase/2-dehydro-3-deoxy-phosphogluconate aldolase [Oscillospiraceae bacterium]
MNFFERLRNNPLIPHVAAELPESAVQTARALLAGGIDILEIPLGSAAGLEALRAISAQVPEMLVGGGGVFTIPQAKAVLDAGGEFILCPGFDPDLINWCGENKLCVLPGCTSASELAAAAQLGLSVVSFSPANFCGGLAAMRALSAPFPGMKLIPSGGVTLENIGEYSAALCVLTVGGDFVCGPDLISAGNFEKITELSKKAMFASLDFQLRHIGINCNSDDEAISLAGRFENAFGFPKIDGGGSVFAGTEVEVMKRPFHGALGHIALLTSCADRALPFLIKKGLTPIEDSLFYKDGRLFVVYFQEDFGGFAVHLLQKLAD